MASSLKERIAAIPAEQWPEKVPVLTARDMYRDFYDSLDGDRHCVVGWRRQVFALEKGRGSAAELVDELLHKEAKHLMNVSVFYMNDNRRVSKTTIADLWNRVMRRLGYVVECER